MTLIYFYSDIIANNVISRDLNIDIIGVLLV